MSAERRRNGKERVLRAAFRAWSETYFTNTSLASVAAQLGVSKAALYRHFENKAALIHAMEKSYVSEFLETVVVPLEEWKEERFSSFVREYFSRLFEFFRRRPEYYVFFAIHILKVPVLEQLHVKELVLRHRKLLADRLASFGYASPEDPPVVDRYLPFFGIYWLVEVYRIHEEDEGGCSTFRGLDLPEEPSERDRAIENAVRICLGGFVSGEELSEGEMERIERIGWIGTEEMLEPDRIFSAIEEVVAEVGFSGATVERIAERIGMTKSSLYFYFRNKDDMFGKVVEREKAHFSRLMRSRLRYLETLPEKLYALILMIAAYAINNPTQLTVLNWLRYRDLGIRAPRKAMERMRDAFAFLEEARRKGELRAPKDSFLSLAVFPNFLVTREVVDGNLGALPFQERIAALRRLYRLVERGLAPDEIDQSSQEGWHEDER
ncbi:MAG: TetR/AcrR family transcriptional regulator [Spirochaetaceae bacterium]